MNREIKQQREKLASVNSVNGVTEYDKKGDAWGPPDYENITWDGEIPF